MRINKLYKIFLTIGIVMFLYSCNDDSTATEIIQELELISLDNNTSKESITNNLYFPSSLPSDANVNLTYESMNPDVISNSGIVTQQEEDVIVFVKVIVQGAYEFEIEISYVVLSKIIQLYININIDKFQLYEEEILFEAEYFDASTFDLIILPEGFQIDYFMDAQTNEVISLDNRISESKVLLAILKFKTYELTYLNENDELIYYEQYDYMDKYKETYIPIKEGYQFHGWYYINEFGHEVDLINNYTFITTHIKAYPLWIKI